MTSLLEDYIPIVGEAIIDEMIELAKPLRGKKVIMVNSTSSGGGVAEILVRFIPLLRQLGLEVEWKIEKGSDAFWSVTKAFHNGIHGDPVKITKEMLKVYLKTNEENAEEMNFDADFVIIHDPQPAAFIERREKGGAYWIWRCHIDTSHADPFIWNFLKPFVSKYDTTIFSIPLFSKELPNPQVQIYPAIDPLSEKNIHLGKDEARDVLIRYGIDPKRPVITQISRFDRLKDPIGVLESYRMVKKSMDIQLILAGGTASDDPEGEEVLAEVRERAGNDKDIHILVLPPHSNMEINALQTASSIVIQKSLREGFGLTVAEALWKGRPVIAGAVGGIPSQVLHGVTGMLVRSIEGCALQIRYLLNNPEKASLMGEYGREHVRENFLLIRNIRRYLLLFHMLLNPGQKVIHTEYTS